MTDFVSDLSSPHWWMSVVVVSIIIHVVGHYVTKALDQTKVATFDWWRARRALDHGALHAEAHRLRQTRPNAAEWLRTVEIRQRFHALVFLTQAMGAAVLFVLFTLIGAPRGLNLFTVALFALLWLLFVRQTRAADRASSLAELLRDSV